MTRPDGVPSHLVIDSHAHLVAPDALYVYRSSLLAMGEYARNLRPAIDDTQLAQAASKNVAVLDAVGTDMQLLSPRPFMQMQSARPTPIVHWWIAANNDVIAQTVELHPTRFAGVAGLPLCHGEPIESCFEELDRCIDDLGFVGVSLNPDPGEGLGSTPPMGDTYWYPLYEKLVAGDIPAMIHSSSCHDGRENYSEHFITEESIAILSVLRSDVFRDFPGLKLMVPHGGGSVPYQVGRWQAARALPGLATEETEPFEVSLRRFWFDTVLYNEASLRLLFEVVGPDRCLFGTEKPGSGSAPNAASGRDYDDLKPVLDGIASLTAEDRVALFEGNARRVFSRLEGRLKVSSDG